MMLEKSGTNTAGWQFWKLQVPHDLAPNGLEVAIHTNHHGIAVGDGYITWDELDEARAALSETSLRNSSRSGDGEADTLPDHVLFICIAYESGFGHAGRDLINPYARDSDEWHAYAHGKAEGEDRAAQKTN